MPVNESKVYQMPASRLTRELMWRYGKHWIIGLTLVSVIFGLIGAILDLRWLLIAFMIFLIIMPSIVGLVYYSYALNRECFVNRLPHTVALVEDNLRVTLKIKTFKEDEELNEDHDEAAENPEYRDRVETFPGTTVVDWEPMEKGGLVIVKDKNRGFIFIDYDAFESPGDFRMIADWARSKRVMK